MAEINLFPGTQIVPTNENGAVCLFEDTEVLTPNGYINVQKLKKNDYIITDDNRILPIIEINHSVEQPNNNTFPYLIPKNFFYENYPPKDCRMTGGHKILINSKWLVPMWSGGRLKQDKNFTELLHFYHIELPNYETDNLVINGGLVVESLANRNIHKKRDIEVCRKRELPENTYQFPI